MDPETTWSRVNFSDFIRRYINASLAWRGVAESFAIMYGDMYPIYAKARLIAVLFSCGTSIQLGDRQIRGSHDGCGNHAAAPLLDIGFPNP
jgi:hypothetical protein